MARKNDPFGMYEGVEVPETSDVEIIDANVADAHYLFDHIEMRFPKKEGLYSYRYYNVASDNALMGVFSQLLGEGVARGIYEKIKKDFTKKDLYSESSNHFSKPEMYTSACVGLLAFSLGEKEEAGRIFDAFWGIVDSETEGLLAMAVLGKVLGKDDKSKALYGKAFSLSTNETLYSGHPSGHYDTKKSALKMVYHELDGRGDAGDILDAMNEKISKNDGLFVWGSHMAPHSHASIDDNALVGIYLCLKGGRRI